MNVLCVLGIRTRPFAFVVYVPELTEELICLLQELPTISVRKADEIMFRMLSRGFINTDPYWRKYNKMYIQWMAQKYRVRYASTESV